MLITSLQCKKVENLMRKNQLRKYWWTTKHRCAGKNYNKCEIVKQGLYVIW